MAHQQNRIAYPTAPIVSRSRPHTTGKIMPASELRNPPNPITEATAFVGNTSDTVVENVADQA